MMMTSQSSYAVAAGRLRHTLVAVGNRMQVWASVCRGRHVDTNIRKIVENDRAGWVRMRDALWPGSLADHDEETRRHFDARAAAPIVFVAEAAGALVGFLELDFRKYAPGCRSSPVPFIEGWYVEPAFRRRGIGRGLVAAAESYAREAGHDEIASDLEVGNDVSLAAHGALGYEEVERVVCMRRSLPA
jgi:aminoglycoside 6'-N-acetyltransferase I